MLYKCASPAGTMGPHPLGENEQNIQGEATEKFLVQHVLARNPRPLLWTVTLPIHQERPASTQLADIQDALDHVGVCPVNDSDWIVNRWIQFGL